MSNRSTTLTKKFLDAKTVTNVLSTCQDCIGTKKYAIKLQIYEVTAAEAPIINEVNAAEAADINEVKTAESAEEKLPGNPTIKSKVEKGLI